MQKPELVIFGFEGNISEVVARRLAGHDTPLILLRGKSAIDDLLVYLQRTQPYHILGLGEYSERDRDKLRIETVCNNKFRNQYEGGARQQLRINTRLQPGEKMKMARGIGSLYCNLVSYRIMQLVVARRLQPWYSFVHIPKSFDAMQAAEAIKLSLRQAKNL